MRRSVTVILAIAAVVATGMVFAINVEKMPQSAIVERFDARLTVKAEMPGKSLANGGTQFDGEIFVNELSFLEGSVPFNGEWIEFAGKEEAFIRSSYSGQMVFPQSSGTVTVSGVSTASGAVEGDLTFAGDFQLGGDFSKSKIDVGPLGEAMECPAEVQSWSSKVVPELNGARVTSVTNDVLVELDASAGIGVVVTSGDIVATSGLSSVEEPAMHKASAGLLLLCMGLLGRGLLALRRR